MGGGLHVRRDGRGLFRRDRIRVYNVLNGKEKSLGIYDDQDEKSVRGSSRQAV